MQALTQDSLSSQPVVFKRNRENCLWSLTKTLQQAAASTKLPRQPFSFIRTSIFHQNEKSTTTKYIFSSSLSRNEHGSTFSSSSSRNEHGESKNHLAIVQSPSSSQNIARTSTGGQDYIKSTITTANEREAKRFPYISSLL